MEESQRPLQKYATRLSSAPARLLLGGVSLGLALAALVMAWLMNPPLAEVAILVQTLAVTSILSLGAGFFLYRRGLARSPSLALTLTLAYVWAGLLTLINVLVMARLMFVSPHDLALALVLMLFAAVIAGTFGLFVAAGVTDGLQQLAGTAEQLAAGDLEARADVNGRDEVAQLAAAFNDMAAQLQQAAAEQEEVEQLRRNLIAWTSHDLRTPLTSIRAMIEALDDGMVEDPERVQRYYKTLRADVLSLSQLIDDLFELAQLNAGSLQMDMAPHSLRDLISDALEGFQVLARQRGVALSGSVGEGVDLVEMDAARIARVLNNLLANALQFTPQGGTVEVWAEQTTSGVRLTVEDSGAGFPDEDLPHVFEQFYRGEQARSRATGGAGLGLAITHAIVEAHGGSVWAANVPSGGARVGFLLPTGQSASLVT